MQAHSTINSTNGRFLTQAEKKEAVPPSREPGKVPSQVPSAEIEKKFYHFYRLWNRRAA